MCRSILLLITLCLTTQTHAAERPNVLFIAVDDLRPELACYGKQHIHSPNIDKLAASGTLFERAFCMVPTCGASRASLMTGIRPARKRFVNFLTWAERDAPGITTMNTQFKKNGYYTASLGKIFHHPKDSAQGWSEPAWRPQGVPWYQQPKNQEVHAQRLKEGKKQGKKWKGPAWESADMPDNAYMDGVLAEKAISTLQQLKGQDEPFFLAVGFFKPHLPFIAPQKYWDLYDHDKIQLPATYHVPKDAPKESIHNSGELRSYADIPRKGPVSDEAARNLIHGYYACVSYTDAQIGKLLAELDRLKLSDNTIVVLWGDHGWNLGDHTLWCKHSCYESSLQIPLIVRAPGIKGGQRRSALIESIDVYPSLCTLTGIPLPEHLAGQSFVGLMRDPDTKWKQAAVSRFRNGDTIRTDTLRYTEYTYPKGKRISRMLYDHTTDPAEDTNVVKDRIDESRELSRQLKQLKGRDGKKSKSD
ncbi:sulfatase [uncultured Gimesia sp.]|uniref:sulfatase n=1 Tax=uncultured Gimesia sp. TaxID=1678688 RepID=UPI0030D994A2|tara:strand:- start:10781 stop:12202 length:1422 start_codon:yes stop_codon:yes gene_type:complete